MPKKHSPRKGSMQFWPRKRAKKPYARVRSWAGIAEAAPLGFAGYKVGMTHILINKAKTGGKSQVQRVFVPVSILECPPLKVYGVRAYRESENGLKVATEVVVKADKELSRKTPGAKKETKKIDSLKPEDYSEFRLLVYTQPKLTGIGKKKPEIFEIAIGGKPQEQFEYAKNVLGKEISIGDVFKEGEYVDVHGITKGKGVQGPLKRFGIKRTSHKSEKSVRTPGSLGGWVGQGVWMWRVAKAGHMGYNVRTEYNKWLLKIGKNPEEINVKGGFLHYGIVKNDYIIVKGSVQGTPKRLLKLTKAIRPDPKAPREVPPIHYVSTESPQGK
ncbi:50S ribosomal protein L3 [Candidatus Woesearchaeota archaeon]|nr:MAG: 50S ribosomal protein L3 [Candidatus Woesearchaeota archaeon]